LADAAMHAGDFERAIQLFGEYQDSAEHPEAEWVLKLWVLEG